MGADTVPDEAEALVALAEECGLRTDQARERIRRVGGAMAGWRDAARRNQIHEQEIMMMAESIDVRLEAVRAVASS